MRNNFSEQLLPFKLLYKKKALPFTAKKYKIILNFFASFHCYIRKQMIQNATVLQVDDMI
jgi:hypothetical protein